MKPIREFTVVHAGNLGVHEATGRSAIPVLEGFARLLKTAGSERPLARLVFAGRSEERTMAHVTRLGLDGGWRTSPRQLSNC